MWELYRRLPGTDVLVLADRAEGQDAFDRTAPLRIERTDFQFRSWGALSMAAGRTYLRAARDVRRVVRTFQPDVIHCGKVLPEGLVALLARSRKRPPVWCFAHGEELTLAKTSVELSYLTASVLKRAATIVANSQHTRSILVDRWQVAPERVAVLTPGVDATRFVPAPTDDAVRARFGWIGRRVILTVGALQKRKGQDMMIRALPAIRRRCPDVLYAIAGEGWEIDALRQLARDLHVEDAVAFHGVPDDVSLVQYYQQCDLFALPNRQVNWDFEGFGIVLLEAQACGKAVIAGRSGGTAETIEPGRTGELVTCDTPEPLADACVALLEDAARRAAMGLRAREWVLERFDWPVLMRQAAALFGGSRTAV